MFVINKNPQKTKENVFMHVDTSSLFPALVNERRVSVYNLAACCFSGGFIA